MKRLQREAKKMYIYHLTTCLPPARAARSWLFQGLWSRGMKALIQTRCGDLNRNIFPLQGLTKLPAPAQTASLHNMFTQHYERKVISPTNSGVPKMFLNSFPALIWCAIPKSISLIRGLGTFLSSSMIFSGWRVKNIQDTMTFWDWPDFTTSNPTTWGTQCFCL